MKTYKCIVEEIGLTTGPGIANFDPIMQGRPPKRRSVFESLGICEEHKQPFKYHNGEMACEMCVAKVAK
jgi:hypothetical protein